MKLKPSDLRLYRLKYTPMDLLRVERTLRERGIRLHFWGIGWKAFGLCFYRVDRKGPAGFHQFKEEMDRRDYSCAACGRQATVEYPVRRRDPWVRLPMGWIIINGDPPSLPGARGPIIRNTAKYLCGYCYRDYQLHPDVKWSEVHQNYVRVRAPEAVEA